MKWRYFEVTWKDVESWKDATDPSDWLPSGKLALGEIWQEYKELSVQSQGPITGSKRPRSPDDFERATNMALLTDEEELDELESWISTRPFELDQSESLPQFWLRQRKTNPRLAQMGLDMASIPAMSSECERVFSQGKLLITGQRNRLRADIIEATQCLRMWLIMDRKAAGLWKDHKGDEKPRWVTPLEVYNPDEDPEEASEDKGSLDTEEDTRGNAQ
jgi:hypothetical protein